MTKYAIMTALVKAGCDLDKLPSEILDALEVITEKNTQLNIGTDNNSENTQDIKGEIMKNIMILKAEDKFNIAIRYNIDEVSDYMVNGNYKKALSEIMDASRVILTNSRIGDDPKNACRKVAELLGKLV